MAYRTFCRRRRVVALTWDLLRREEEGCTLITHQWFVAGWVWSSFAVHPSARITVRPETRVFVEVVYHKLVSQSAHLHDITSRGDNSRYPIATAVSTTGSASRLK